MIIPDYIMKYIKYFSTKKNTKTYPDIIVEDYLYLIKEKLVKENE